MNRFAKKCSYQEKKLFRQKLQKMISQHTLLNINRNDETEKNHKITFIYKKNFVVVEISGTDLK